MLYKNTCSWLLLMSTLQMANSQQGLICVVQSIYNRQDLTFCLWQQAGCQVGLVSNILYSNADTFKLFSSIICTNFYLKVLTPHKAITQDAQKPLQDFCLILQLYCVLLYCCPRLKCPGFEWITFGTESRNIPSIETFPKILTETTKGIISNNRLVEKSPVLVQTYIVSKKLKNLNINFKAIY